MGTRINDQNIHKLIMGFALGFMLLFVGLLFRKHLLPPTVAPEAGATETEREDIQREQMSTDTDSEGMTTQQRRYYRGNG